MNRKPAAGRRVRGGAGVAGSALVPGICAGCTGASHPLPRSAYARKKVVIRSASTLAITLSFPTITSLSYIHYLHRTDSVEPFFRLKPERRRQVRKSCLRSANQGAAHTRPEPTPECYRALGVDLGVDLAPSYRNPSSISRSRTPLSRALFHHRSTPPESSRGPVVADTICLSTTTSSST